MFHNSNKSKLLTLIKFVFNYSTYHLGLLASQLTAALPFSMRTSRLNSSLKTSVGWDTCDACGARKLWAKWSSWPSQPWVLSIEQKFGFKFRKFRLPNRTVHSSCTDPTQATTRLVIILVSRIQKSGTGDNNFVKWKGTFQSDWLKWPDWSKRTTLKAGPKYSGWTKPKWTVPFDVPTKISGILGWMESAPVSGINPGIISQETSGTYLLDTVELHLMATLVIQSPCYYGQFFWPGKKAIHFLMKNAC